MAEGFQHLPETPGGKCQRKGLPRCLKPLKGERGGEPQAGWQSPRGLSVAVPAGLPSSQLATAAELGNIFVLRSSVLPLLLFPLPLALFAHPVLHCLISGLVGTTKTHNKASQK